MLEIEVKVLGINRLDVETTLGRLGAKPYGERRLTAVFFDFADGRLGAEGLLLRLRQEDDRVLLTFKRRIDEEDAKVCKETEVEASDFGACRSILSSLGLVETAHVDKLRTSYQLRGASVAIDRHIGELAFIPEFLEIEAGCIEDVHAIAARLGFKPDELRPWGLPQLIEYYREDA